MNSIARFTQVAATIMVVAAVALGSFSATAAGGKSIAFAAVQGTAARV
jgi:hypothetical protein